MLSFYNTLTKQKETFEPQNEGGVVTMYNCGPTVYHYAHIGNLRSYIFADVLRRFLDYEGYSVKQVINITDVGHLVSDGDEGEDKIAKGARREGKTVDEIVDFYTNAYFEDLRELNIDPENVFAFPRASLHIDEQIKLIQKLEEKGYTYHTSDGVYFDTSRSPRYGELAGLDIEGLAEGARVEKNPEKRNTTDFALWKFSKQEEKRLQEWDSPWGRGFPGWHIECSAMSMAYLGETLDIHTGGVDHIPVHHTNEIAQSESATGKPFARFWLHNEFVVIEDGKMAKSENNIIRLQTLRDQGHHPLAYRYLVLQAHYRSPITFTFKALKAAQNALYNLVVSLSKLQFDEHAVPDQTYSDRFKNALEDDLNTPQALSVLFELLQKPEVSEGVRYATVCEFDSVLGLDLEGFVSRITDIPDHVYARVEKRQQAKQQREWDRADQIREEIKEQGFVVRDTDLGSEVYRASLL